ncbi:hypothetical protein [Cellulomonas fimi]|uniref:hypothetical protein n=1 Tax=Cellulomonas fimi TaxID=1708 RepID=UPI0020135F01|nr:hypothetical protein [Cellulomonas fimi]
MTDGDRLGRLVLAAHVRAATVRGRVVALARDDRGDVPGWVLVTLMTAGLVIALWALAGPALGRVFTESIQRVTGEIG